MLATNFLTRVSQHTPSLVELKSIWVPPNLCETQMISNQLGIRIIEYHMNTRSTTTKPYPTKWGRLHGSNDAIVIYYKPNLDPTH